MSKTKLLIWAVMLAVPGGVGLWTVQSFENLHEQQVRLWRPQVQEVTDEYLESYRKWVTLSYDEKAENPWGHGEYGGTEIQKKLQLDQNKRLTVDIAELANGSKSVPPELASLMYGPDWVEKVADYQHDRKVCEAINILSSACIVVGTLLFAVIGIIWLVGAVVAMRKKHAEKHKSQGNESTKSVAAPVNITPPLVKEEVPQAPDQTAPLAPKETAAEASSEVSKESASQAPKETTSQVPTEAGSQAPKESKPQASREKEASLLAPRKKENDKEKSTVNSGYFESLRQRSKVGSPKNSPIPATSSMSSQYASVVQEAEPVSMMTPEPVMNSLSELTEEVSAIRQYAAQQQDQMRKLQDGYDWMLIRRFCMRIIRCIDNISDRIEQLNAESGDSNPHTLEDIRDELIYALESSGVEAFSPDVGSAYKGLERYAEAVHDRCTNNDPERSGTIAKVVRPGYQYLINESEIKVVRCAQVQLYE